MKSFPSPLPPNTVVDCILDADWRTNGILHVLDVIRWKGQDIADCETPFRCVLVHFHLHTLIFRLNNRHRLWWRDTRMSELPSFPPPGALSPSLGPSPVQQYEFHYPNTLLCVPYHLDLSISHLTKVVVPLARSQRQIPIVIPVQSQASESMELDQVEPKVQIELMEKTVTLSSDGMLLYVSQATYEPGTSPLSLWIPVKTYGEETTTGTPSSLIPSVGPLDIFERYDVRCWILS